VQPITEIINNFLHDPANKTHRETTDQQPTSALPLQKSLLIIIVSIIIICTKIKATERGRRT